MKLFVNGVPLIVRSRSERRKMRTKG